MFSSRKSPTSRCIAGESASARSGCSVDLFTQSPPLSSTNGCFLQTSRTTRSVILARSPEPREVQLFHFVAVAHVVHQVKRSLFGERKP